MDRWRCSPPKLNDSPQCPALQGVGAHAHFLMGARATHLGQGLWGNVIKGWGTSITSGPTSA